MASALKSLFSKPYATVSVAEAAASRPDRDPGHGRRHGAAEHEDGRPRGADHRRGLAVWPALAIGPRTPGGIVILTAAAILAIIGVSGFCPLYLGAGRAGRGTRRPA